MSGRIALFMPSLRGGGVERLMPLLAEGFTRRGLSVDLLLARAEGPFLESIPEGVRLIDLNSRMTITSLPGLVGYLKVARPQVLIAAMNAVIPALIAKRFFMPGIRVLARQDNTYSMQFATASLKTRMALTLMRYLLPSAHAVIAVSTGVAEDLKRVVPGAADLVHVIYNPVIREEIAMRSAEPTGHPWLCDSDTPVVLAVGRLVPQKDYSTLLRAFAEVVRVRPARLVVLGEGSEGDRLAALAKDLRIADIVDFHGYADNPYSYMAKSHVLVLSSVFEGLPTVLIEAMACGTPVVSTDCPSGPREILQDGVLGRLVPVGDWRTLGQAILETLQNPIQSARLVDGANRFSVESSIQQHFKLVSELNG